MPRLRPSCGMCDGARIAEPADGGDLRTGREIARAGEAALVDEALGDDVEPRLGGGRAAAGGEAGVEHELGHLHGDQHVLFELHHLDRVDAGRVVPGQMQMRVDHAGHQRRAHAVDHRRAAVPPPRSRAEARGAAGDLLDAVALDQHLAGVGIFAGGIEDAHIGEERSARPLPFQPCRARRHDAFLPVRGARHSAAHVYPQIEPAQEIRQQLPHSCDFLDRRPMAAAIEDHGHVAPLDLVGDRLRDAGRADGIVVAGDEQRRAVDEPQIGRARAWPAPRRSGQSPPDPGA